MNNGKTPDPNELDHVIEYDKETFVKPLAQNPNTNEGEFADIEDDDLDGDIHSPCLRFQR